MRPVKIAPSLLAADFGAFAEAVEACESAGTEWFHFDVMDGHFVPNITYGMPLVRALRGRSRAVFDAHLMIAKPERYVEEFVAAGADVVTVHAEACTHLQRTLSQIRRAGAKAGLALNPATPLNVLEYVLEDVDLLLVMTVNPGFGGQAFLTTMLPKIAAARRLLDPAVELEVDGGVGPQNARALAEAGASVLVAGSSVFGHSGGPAAGIDALRAAIS